MATFDLMSSAPHTASHQAPAEPRRSGIELSTLLVAGVAAVVATVVVQKIWATGTIWATAFTPIIVALVKEALERPVKRVSAVATRAAVPPPLARAARTVVQPPPEAQAPPPPMVMDPDLTERRVYGSRVGGLQRRWKLAVITGLLAFAGVVALFTLPELVAGRSVTAGTSHTHVLRRPPLVVEHEEHHGHEHDVVDQDLDRPDVDDDDAPGDDAGDHHAHADHDDAAGPDDHDAVPGAGHARAADDAGDARPGARDAVAILDVTRCG